MLSRKQFEEFVEPYTKKLNERIHSLGHLIFYHICGDSTPILKNMANTGVDFISVDHNVDLAVAKELRCDLPPEVPLENIEYFMEAAKQYGRVK